MRSFSRLYAEVENTPSYIAEQLGAEFMLEVHAKMVESKVTPSELARRMGVAPSYVTKLFSAPSNFTLCTMAKVSSALGLKIHVKLAADDLQVHWRGIVRSAQKPAANEEVQKNWEHYVNGAAVEQVRYDEAYALAA